MSAAGVAALLPLPVVIPACGAIAAPLLRHLHRRLPLIGSLLAMAGSTAVLCIIAARVYAGPGHLLSHFMGHWGPVNGNALGIAFAADPFGLAFALASSALGALFLLSALSELGGLGPRELGWFACLFQLLLAALIGAALTADTMNLFVWFEVAALASYGLTGFFLERPIALEAAFKLLVLTTIASFAVFVAVALLYSAHGALNFGQLHHALVGHIGAPSLLALALMLCGFGTKAGIVPFHTWLPDAHTAPPGSVSAMFSGLMVNLGVVAIVRLVLQIYGAGMGHAVLGLLTALGISSALLGALMALAQDDLKRLLAWDTVSQMGILLVGFATASHTGVAGATYHLVNHALFKGLLFLCAGAIVHATGKTGLSEMGGLARLKPALAAGFTVGVWAIAGIPPMNGYVSLGLIHESLQETGQPTIFVLALIAQVITIAALSRAAYLAFFRRRAEAYDHIEPLRPGMITSLATLGAGCVAFGIFPQFLVRHLAVPAAGIVLDPDRYANGIFSGATTIQQHMVTFDYTKPSDLIIASVTTVLGLALAAAYLRIREPLPVRVLRAIHTGSVNDYATFTAAGLVCAMLVLLAAT